MKMEIIAKVPKANIQFNLRKESIIIAIVQDNEIKAKERRPPNCSELDLCDMSLSKPIRAPSQIDVISCINNEISIKFK